MIIEESDFRMTQSGDNSLFWDLELKHIVRPKGKPSREELKESGYGMPLVTCLKKVALYRLSQKQEIYTLKEYIKEYSREINELKTLLKDA
jgi:hypothetical protein